MQVLAESDAGDGDVGRSVHYCGRLCGEHRAVLNLITVNISMLAG